MTMKNLPDLGEKALPKGVADGVRAYDEALRNAWGWLDKAEAAAEGAGKDMQSGVPGAQLVSVLHDHAGYADDAKRSLERRQAELIKALAKIGSK